MEKIIKNSKIIFPILAIITGILGGYNSFKIMKNSQQVQQAKSILEQSGNNQIFFTKIFDMSLPMSILVSLISVLIAVGIAYLICKLIYKSINKENPNLLNDFNKNHFAIMSFKYIALLISIILNLILDGKMNAIISTIIVVIMTIAGANLVFNKERYDGIKSIPNIILYGIMGIF